MGFFARSEPKVLSARLRASEGVVFETLGIYRSAAKKSLVVRAFIGSRSATAAIPISHLDAGGVRRGSLLSIAGMIPVE